MKWTKECEEAFQNIKKYLGNLLMLSTPKECENLYVYLAISEHTISSVLIREEDAIQWPIYYVSKSL